MAEFTLVEVQREIAARGLGWQAGATSLADLPPEAQNRRLGLRVDPVQKERLRGAFQTVVCAPCEFPPIWDWRAVDGQDWTTPIRDQGACGSCVAFGVLGAVEGMAKWRGGDPGRDVNLSEAHLFFCGCGPCCESGWWPEDALDYLVEQGVPDEDCFRYQDRDLACRDTCNDWAEHAVRISAWQEILDASARKQWLSHIGPLVGAMAVYRDFFYYTGGVYRPVSTDLAGYHAVAVVGYDEAQAAWLCKNSWGDKWGEAGWFRLAYGACCMDSDFPAWGIEQVLVPAEHEQAAAPQERRRGARIAGITQPPGAPAQKDRTEHPDKATSAMPGGPAQRATAPSSSVPVFDDPRAALKVEAGNTFVLALKAFPAASYTWQAQTDSRFLVLMEQRFEPASSAIGSTGRERLTFHALRSGRCQLELLCSRPWEKSVKERRILTVDIL